MAGGVEMKLTGVVSGRDRRRVFEKPEMLGASLQIETKTSDQPSIRHGIRAPLTGARGNSDPALL